MLHFMEGSPRTHESDVLQFCIIAIESATFVFSILAHSGFFVYFYTD